MVEPLMAHGDVWLVGAGPGDPDLLTRRAEKLIKAATIIFYDALVGPEILALAARGARLISVGKRSGRHSKDQTQINALLIAAARAGEAVVRLKGGDPSMFGRSAEEIEALAEQGISCRICPGITAASAAAAHVGASLTLRGVARDVRFATAHAQAGAPLDLDWPSLATGRSTLAIYMGRAAAPEIARQLLAHGLAGDTPVLIASNVSLPDEQLLATRLDLLPIAAMSAPSGAPSLLLIGKALAPACGATDKARTNVAHCAVARASPA